MKPQPAKQEKGPMIRIVTVVSALAFCTVSSFSQPAASTMADSSLDTATILESSGPDSTPSGSENLDTAGYTIYNYDTHRNSYKVTHRPKDTVAPVQDGQQPLYAPANQSQPRPAGTTAPASTTGTVSKRKSSQFDDYMLGKADGQRDAIGSPGWVFAGLTGTYFCLCIGCAGIGLAMVVPPSPPASAFVGKSSSYIQGYSEGYKSKARLKNALYASVGCGIAAIINLIISLTMGYPGTGVEY